MKDNMKRNFILITIIFAILITIVFVVEFYLKLSFLQKYIPGGFQIITLGITYAGFFGFSVKGA